MSATVTKKQSKSSPKQSFIRLNLDAELENMLSEYELKYKLLGRSDIIRMLLSEISWQKKILAKREFSNFLQELPKPQTNFSSEDQIFQFMKSNNLL
jgi:DNA primase large subunit